MEGTPSPWILWAKADCKVADLDGASQARLVSLFKVGDRYSPQVWGEAESYVWLRATQEELYAAAQLLAEDDAEHESLLYYYARGF